MLATGAAPKRRFLPNALRAVLIAYSALCAVTCAVQRSMLYPAPRPVRPVAAIDGARVLSLSTGESWSAHVLFAPAPAGARTIVYFHGNGEDLSTSTGLCRLVRAQGFGFAAVEYPGYGLNGSTPSERGIYRAAHVALEHLIHQERVPAQSLVLMGRSLGTGVAVEMAQRGYGHRVVLVSPYTSMTDVAQRIAVVVPVSLLLFDRYETAMKAPSVRQPVLIVHGDADTLIPIEMGRGLARAFPRARIREVAGRGHNDVLSYDEDGALEEIFAFARGEGLSQRLRAT